MKNGCNIIENFTSCLRYRPALTTFTVGICLLGSALVYMDLHLCHMLTHEHILNKNMKSNWNTFVDDLSSVKWCLNKGSDERKDIPNAPSNHSFSHGMAYSIEVNVTKAFIKRHHYGQIVWYAYIKDILPKEHMVKKLSQEVVKLAFDFTNIEVVKSSKKKWRVVNITMILSYNSTIPDTPLRQIHSPIATIPSDPVNETQIYRCEPETSDYIPLKIVNHDERIYHVYISDSERTNIHLHLFSTSCFFFFMAFIILLYGLFKRRANLDQPRTPEQVS